MKKIFIIFAATALVFMACGGDDGTAGSSLQGKWTRSNAQAIVSYTFDSGNFLCEWTSSGNSGSGFFLGTFSFNGKTISFSPLGGDPKPWTQNCVLTDDALTLEQDAGMHYYGTFTASGSVTPRPSKKPLQGNWSQNWNKQGKFTYSFNGSTFSGRLPSGDVFTGGLSYTNTTVTFIRYQGSPVETRWTQNYIIVGDILYLEQNASGDSVYGLLKKEAVGPSLQGTWSYSWGSNYRTLTFSGSNFTFSYSYEGKSGKYSGTFTSTDKTITFTVGTETWTQKYEVWGDESLDIEPDDVEIHPGGSIQRVH